MKKAKVAILLASVAAGLGLVGTTFAAWAITDNADPLNIGISPGAVHTGDNTYSEMTLEWGADAATTFVNISNLENGTSGAQYNSVTVKSNSTGTTHGGNLTLTLTDVTPNDDKDESVHLIDNIVVEVYTTYEAGVYGGKVDDLTIGRGTSQTTANKDFTGAAEYTQRFYFKYYIPDGALTSAQYTKINKDQVKFEIDWNRPISIDPKDIGAHLLHVYSPNYVPYLYAWDENDTPITAWPGAAMTAEGNDWYSYGLLDKYNNVIISNNGNNQSANQTIDTSKLYFNGEDWYAEKPEYYLVSELSSWAEDENYKLTYDDDNNEYYIVLTTPTKVHENEVEYDTSDDHPFTFKIKDSGNNIWYGQSAHDNETPNCTWGQGNKEIKVKFTPTKTYGEGHYYVFGQAVQA